MFGFICHFCSQFQFRFQFSQPGSVTYFLPISRAAADELEECPSLFIAFNIFVWPQGNPSLCVCMWRKANANFSLKFSDFVFHLGPRQSFRRKQKTLDKVQLFEIALGMKFLKGGQWKVYCAPKRSHSFRGWAEVSLAIVCGKPQINC